MTSLKQLTLIIMTLTPNISTSQNMDALRRDVQKLFDSVQGTFALAFESPGGKDTLFMNEKMMYHAASTMKTPVMIEVFHQARQGKLSLDDSVLVVNEFASIVDGTKYSLNLSDDSDNSMYKKIGSKVTIRELVFQMITISSNFSTNLLMGIVGPQNVTATMRRLGAMDIEVLRGVEDGKAFDRGMNNRTSALDLMLIMKAIAEGKAVDSSRSKEMLDILLAQRFKDIIPAGLPAGVRVAHKTGSITGVEHDSAIVLLPDGRHYLLVMLSKDVKDAMAAKAVMASASKRIYEYVTEGK